ncbi:MAG: CinA family protein [SAR202 cluster bacterium]|jgi:nicotinamide-nucleotide amidase|nr:MAG: CinA family protein [SAR202 cluster bacterium]MAR86551.1 damage-inducible protein [Chloroflexota bacterium]KAA1305568.1 MAG: CinA family protein [SAR202 cluster bacterium]MEC7733334.1 CinA family protein [Chloroflexota bacterium]MEC8986998.1 CinA family protein [Chloroflexota bacterium]|tara:strand:- start:1219 stop:1710 length:492 start_codon:yes stop_codon:yes gene_type:complete
MDKEILRLADRAATLLKESNQTIGIAESSSGGLISAHLLAIPGASRYFIGGSVIYTRVAQKGLLKVTDGQMDGLRASTEEYASLNAKTIKETLETTWGLSETGATGPSGNRYGDSAGHSCVGVSGPVSRAMTIETGVGEREQNMLSFTKEALGFLINCLEESR